MDRGVVDAMLPYIIDEPGNPSSFHMPGKRVKDAVEASRKLVSSHLGCRADEVVFTSGGTESDNLAILGYARANAARGKHIVTTAIEHHAVLEAVERLEKEGFDVSIIGVEPNGVVDAAKVLDAIREDTILVSVMLANNEIGTVQPVADIGRGIKKLRESNKSIAVLHTDACQAAGYMDLDIRKLHVEMLTLNGSKIYGPKGVGVLYVRRGLKIEPLMFGGAQESRLRPGTENVAGIVGLAKALDICVSRRESEAARMLELRDMLIDGVLESIPKTRLNGDRESRLPNNANISFLDIEGEALLLYLDAKGVAASTGSACTSASLDPSHVVLALGVPFEVAHGSIRFSLGRSTTKKDIDYVLGVLPEIVEKLRSISPVNLDLKHTE